MTARGRYARTDEIRDRNSRNAGPGPCPPGCTCGKHTGSGHGKGGGKPCPPGCWCDRHRKTAEHRRRIGEGVKRAAERRKTEH